MVVPWGTTSTVSAGAEPARGRWAAGRGRDWPRGSSVNDDEPGLQEVPRGAAAEAWAACTVTARPSGRSLARTPRRSPRAPRRSRRGSRRRRRRAASLRAATSARRTDLLVGRSSSATRVARCCSPVSRVLMAPPRRCAAGSLGGSLLAWPDPIRRAETRSRACGRRAVSRAGEVRDQLRGGRAARPAGAPTCSRVPRSGSSVGTRCSASRPGRSKITESQDAAATCVAVAAQALPAELGPGVLGRVSRRRASTSSSVVRRSQPARAPPAGGTAPCPGGRRSTAGRPAAAAAASQSRPSRSR